MNVVWPAALALLPAAIGPLPSEPDSFTFALCGSSRVITIEVDGKAPVPEQVPPCHGKACHGGDCRKKFDRAQRQAPE